jgi:hypothetical protein
MKQEPLLHRLTPVSGRRLSSLFLQKLKDEEVDPEALVILHREKKLWTVLEKDFEAAIEDWVIIQWNIENNPDFIPVHDKVYNIQE